ncbi:MAG: 30S ribosomal protein S20 [Thermodesulfovibrionales bacterium]|nr:30S ribosomal protein S20 [Thermodesulfovibrionales bacterium]
MATKATTRKKKKLSVLKRVRQTKKNTLRNTSVKSKIKTFVKKFESVCNSKDKEAIEKSLRETVKVLSSAASKGVIHKNTASRKISRLTLKANKALASAVEKPKEPVANTNQESVTTATSTE